MADNFIGVPADSTGKKIAAQDFIRGVNTVLAQEIVPSFQMTSTSIGVGVTTTPTQILAAKPARRGLMIQNWSDTHIFCRFDPSTTPTVVVTPGAEVGFVVPANLGAQYFVTLSDTRGMSAAHQGVGTCRLLITEW